MLRRTTSLVVAGLAAAAGCGTPASTPETSETGDSTTETDTTGVGDTIKLANEEDFAAGPLELICSVDRVLTTEELEPTLPTGTASAVELNCDLLEGKGSSVVYVSVNLAAAVPSLEALVGVPEVTVLFSYGGSNASGPGIDADITTTVFAVRDEVGPLLISQQFNCDGPIEPPGLACELLRPPFMVEPTWSDPLPAPTLADVGCGTRPWEYARPPGVFEMNRLAVRFETDEGVVDAIDHAITPLSIAGNTYDFFATEAVGELEDPAVVFDSRSYEHSVRFLITRTPSPVAEPWPTPSPSKRRASPRRPRTMHGPALVRRSGTWSQPC